MAEQITITLTFTRAEAELLRDSLDDWQSMLERREGSTGDPAEGDARVKLERALVGSVREAVSEALWPPSG